MFCGQSNLELFKHFPDNVEVTIHNVFDKNNDWLHDELNEAAGKLTTCTITWVSSELFFGWVEVVITPELLHEFCYIKFEFLGVSTSESGKGESPSKKSRSKSYSTVCWVNLLSFSHIIALVSGNNDVCVLDDTLEILIHSLSVNLEFKDTTINFVYEKYWLNLFTESLTQNCLSLHANSFDVIDNDKGTVSDTEGSCDFRREINVSRGVDQVDEVRK